MQFTVLREPHISCSHVMAHMPLLYRLDARSATSSIVVSEYSGRQPFIETNGDPSENRRLIAKSLLALDKFSAGFWVGHYLDEAPMFTLDLRPAQDRQALLTGFSDQHVSVVPYGYRKDRVEAIPLDVRSVCHRLLDVTGVYYGTGDSHTET